MNKYLKRPLFQMVTSPWENLFLFLFGWLGFQLLGLLVSLCFNGAISSGSLNSRQADMAVNLLVYAIVFLVFFCYLSLYNRAARTTITVGFTKAGGGIATGFYWFVGSLIVSALYSLIVSAIPWMTVNNNQAAIESSGVLFPIPTFVFTVLLAPFCEELTYRGGLNTLIGRWNRIAGLFISAVIFALIHFDLQGIITDAIKGDMFTLYRELLNLPTYIIAGLGLGMAYQSTGNITCSWFCHTFNNLIAFIGMVV